MSADRKPFEVVAVVRIGAQVVGVPAERIAQAVPRPADWLQVPRRGGAIAGVLDHGGRLVPVVQIAAWLGDAGAAAGTADAAGEQRVLLLQDAVVRGRLIGLLVDAVVGIRRVRPDEAQRLFHDDDPTQLFQSALRAGGEGQSPASLLEVDRLMRLTEIWCDEARIADRPVEPASPTPDADADADGPPVERRVETWATFRIGDVLVGVAAGDVTELTRAPQIERLIASDGGARGICRWRGRAVPVVDLTRALQAQPDPAAARWLCIVGRAGQCIGLLVHEVGELRQLERSTARGGPAPSGTDSVVLEAIVEQNGGTLQLIDTGALFGRFPEAAVSQLREPTQAVQRRADAASGASNGYMLFEAGTKLASPVDSVQEVIGLPPDVLRRLEARLPATVEWRGTPVPVVDLRLRPGIAMSEAPRQLAIVVHAGRSTAVAIGGVRAMLPPWRVTRSRTPSGSIDVVTTDEADVRASYHVLDLTRV